MAEMQAGEGLRSGQNAFADVLERLAPGLADAEHMAEFPDHIEGAVEHGGAVGIDGKVDAFSIREVEHGLLEILLARTHDAGRAVRPRRPAVPAAGLQATPTPPPMALTRTVSPRSSP